MTTQEKINFEKESTEWVRHGNGNFAEYLNKYRKSGVNFNKYSAAVKLTSEMYGKYPELRKTGTAANYQK